MKKKNSMPYPILNGITFAKNLGQILPKLPLMIASFFLLNGMGLTVNAQYSETFDADNKGYQTLGANDFAGVTWSVSTWTFTGGASGLPRDDNDFAGTGPIAANPNTPAAPACPDNVFGCIDLDQQFIWSTPKLVAMTTGVTNISLDLTWALIDATADTINVEYRINNGAWIRHASLATGGNVNPILTVGYINGVIDQTGTGTASWANVPINVNDSIRLRVVMRTNVNVELITIDNVSLSNVQIPSSCSNPTAYNVTGGGGYCSGGAGKEVGLANSESGVTYQLKVGGANTGGAVTGTGSAISFGNQTAAGVYTVEATRTAGGCTAMMTGSVTVTVGSPPPVNAVPTVTASDNTPCANTQVLLTATAPGGYTPVEYLWYKNGTAVNYQNGGSGTYLVNAGNTGGISTYTVQIVYSANNLCFSSSSANTNLDVIATNITITPNGPTTFCANNPTSLTATAGLSNYVWRRSTNVVGTNSNTYTPVASGNHNVTITDSYGCTRTSAWLNIITNATPVSNAGIDRSICEGSSVQIGTASNAAFSYTWSPTTGLSSASISNPICAAIASATYTVTTTNTSTGCSSTDAMIFTSLPLPPQPSISSSTAGNQVTLTANSPSATSINWYRNGANFQLNKTPNSAITVNAANPTFAYTLRSKAANGCLSIPSAAVNAKLSDNKGGDMLIDTENNTFTVYPNPTNAVLYIESSQNIETGKIFIYNTMGQMLHSQAIDNSKLQMVNTESLAKGIYLLHIFDGKDTYTQQIVKE